MFTFWMEISWWIQLYLSYSSNAVLEIQRHRWKGTITYLEHKLKSLELLILVTIHKITRSLFVTFRKLFIAAILNWDWLGWLCWGLTSQSTIFQSCRDGAIASWVINRYFRGVKCLAQGHNTAAVGLEPRTSRSRVRHSTTEPPRSPETDSGIPLVRVLVLVTIVLNLIYYKEIQSNTTFLGI